jgi:uncharacterized membrane-anchored protein YjiN (DUF445 family)
MDLSYRELLTRLMTDYVENIQIQATLLDLLSTSIANSRQKLLKEVNISIDESFIRNFLYIFIVSFSILSSFK